MDVDDNEVVELKATSAMAKLRIVRASGNRLSGFDLGWCSNLRTLYLDNNGVGSLTELDRLTKVENMSLRNQTGPGL